MYLRGRGYPLARPRGASTHLWLWTVLFFGVGDLLTTTIGLGPGGAVELNPVAASFGQQFGLAAMVGVKVVTLTACYAMWQVTPRPYRDGIPLGLASLGILVTSWNLHVLVLASVGT